MGRELAAPVAQLPATGDRPRAAYLSPAAQAPTPTQDASLSQIRGEGQSRHDLLFVELRSLYDSVVSRGRILTSRDREVGGSEQLA